MDIYWRDAAKSEVLAVRFPASTFSVALNDSPTAAATTTSAATAPVTAVAAAAAAIVVVAVVDYGLLQVPTGSKAPQGTIPFECDCLVSEWMGYCLLSEWMLFSVLHARDK